MKVTTVARKPCSASSTTSNVARWGCGALDIDGTRVGYISSGDLRETRSRNPGTERRFVSNVYDVTRPMQRMSESGRWPANLVLVHRAGCRHVGTVTTSGYTINRWTDGAKPFGGGAGHGYESEEQPDEQVSVWHCEKGCAVGRLDAQSGQLRAQGNLGSSKGGGGLYGHGPTMNEFGAGDAGAAARFFKQVQIKEMKMDEIPEELWSYLTTMISPPPGCDPLLLVGDLDEVAWEDVEDASVHGIVTSGDPSAHLEEIDRVLRPGAHLLVISTDDEPTGHTAACAIEDFGYEIRDSIAILDTPGEFHYVAKAPPKERHAGVTPRERVREVTRLFPREDADLDLLHAELEDSIKPKDVAAMAEKGLDPKKVPDDALQWLEERTVRTRRVVQNDHPCLHPDDLVMTALGYRPLTEIHEGSLVYAQDGKFHVVEHVSRHPYRSPCLYEIKVLGTNYTTRASDNHPFLIWRPVREKKAIVGGEALWVEAKDVRRGDYTMTPLMADEALDVSPPPDMAEYGSDDEFWFMFGLYLAEGVAHAGGKDVVYPSYTLGDHEDDLHLRVDAYFSHVTVGIYEKAEGAAVQIIPFDKEAGRLFVNLGGKGAATKHLSPYLWSLPTNAREAIFEGYMAGDGGDVGDYRQCKTVSQDLASQMRLLAEGLGYKANLFRYPGRPGKIGNRDFKSVSPEHQVRFYDQNQNLETRKPTRPTYIEHEGQRYLLRYVKEVVEIPYEGDVMNLTVEGSPTFMTPVGMTHNTVKAVKIMERLLRDVPEDALVVDPFMGSGTTGIACMRTGHAFLGIDQDESYVQIADERVRHWDRTTAAWNPIELDSEAPPLEDEAEPEGGVFDMFGGPES